MTTALLGKSSISFSHPDIAKSPRLSRPSSARSSWRKMAGGLFVSSKAMQCAVECAIRFAEHNIPFRIVPGTGGPVAGEAPLGLFLVPKPLSFGRADPRSTPVLLITSPHSEAATGVKRRQAPLEFSMSGLAG